MPGLVVGPSGSGTLANVVAACAGLNYTLAVRSDGTVWFWGDDCYGEDFDGGVAQTVPQQVPGLTNIVAVAPGYGSAIALKSDGTVWAFPVWGWVWGGVNYSYSLLAPAQITDSSGAGFLTGIVAIAGGHEHWLALKSDGTAWAWGSDDCGELGNGITPPGNGASYYSLPVQVQIPGRVTSISAGTFLTLATRSDGTAWACGSEFGYQLGNGTSFSWPLPAHPWPSEVDGPGGIGYLTGVVGVSAGGRYQSVALKSDGTVWAWGESGGGNYGNPGELGTGVYETSYPMQVLGPNGVGYFSGAVAVSAGYENTMVLKSDGSVWTWGDNSYGQLGYGGAYNNYPGKVPGLSGIAAISFAAGSYEQGRHAVALQGPLPAYTVALNASGPGAVACSSSLIAYSYGTPVQLVATAASGDVFTGWTCSGGMVFNPSASSTMMFVTGNTTIVASFAQPIYSASEQDANGTISLSASGLYY